MGSTLINLAATAMSFLVVGITTPTVHAEVVRPKLRLELRLPPEDVPELRQVLLRFAEAHGLQVEDVGAKLPVSRIMPPIKGRRPFILELRHRDIRVRVDNFMELNRFGIAIYEYKASTEGRQIASEFEEQLRSRWPDRLKPFIDK